MKTKDIEVYCEDYAKYLKMFTSIGLPIKKAKEAASNLLLTEHGVTIDEVYNEVGVTDSASIEGREALAFRRIESLPSKILKLLDYDGLGVPAGIISNRCRPALKKDVLASIEILIEKGSVKKEQMIASNNRITEKYFLA